MSNCSRATTRAMTPPRASTPRPVDISKLYYDEQATTVRRTRGSSESSAHRRPIAPFTPRINDDAVSRSTRSGDVFSTLYEIGMDKKRQILQAARVSALSEHDKMWASYRASPARESARQPWDNAPTKVGSAHTPRPSSPTRSVWTARSVSEQRKYEQDKRRAMLRSAEPAPSILRSTKSSLNKEWGAKDSQPSSRTPTPTRGMRDSLSSTFERLSRPRTAARPVLDNKKSLSRTSTKTSVAGVSHAGDISVKSDAAPSQKPLYISTRTHNEPTEESHGTPKFETEPTDFGTHPHEPTDEATSPPQEPPALPAPAVSIPASPQPSKAAAPEQKETPASARASSRRRVIDDLKIDSDDDDSPTSKPITAPARTTKQPMTTDASRSRGGKPLSAIVKQLDSV